MTFEERLEELKKDFESKIEELKAEYKEKDKEDNNWIPKFNETYWYLGNEGSVFDGNWGDSIVENHRLNIGNVFKTKDEAQFELERLKVLTEMKKYSKPFDFDRNNYLIYYVPHQIRVDESYIQTNDIYFENEKMARKAINEIGEERIKKYYLRVEE